MDTDNSREEKRKQIPRQHNLIRVSDPTGIRQIMKNYSINIISKNCYTVKSQSQNKSYCVKKLSESDVWSCECLSFMSELSHGNTKECKHIVVCQKLGRIIESEENIEQVRGTRVCPKCLSTTMTRHGYRIYHNFCRPHSGLPDKITPAEASGIDLNLGENKIHDLIVKSTEPKNFATQLGLRIERVIIVNEKDCIKVSPKGWIEKRTWREINDILRLNEFSWLSNGKDGCWLKLLDEIQKEESSKA